MRRGSVAIVPILIALLLIFWAAWYLGEESDTTHKITQVEKIQEIHKQMAIYAGMMKAKMINKQLQKNKGSKVTQEQIAKIERCIKAKIYNKMIDNGIDDGEKKDLSQEGCD